MGKPKSKATKKTATKRGRRPSPRTPEWFAAIKRGEIKTTVELAAVGFPLGPTPQDIREWSVAEFKRHRREYRQAATWVIQTIPAVDGKIPGSVEHQPLRPPKPHRGGGPAGLGISPTRRFRPPLPPARSRAGRSP